MINNFDDLIELENLPDENLTLVYAWFKNQVNNNNPLSRSKCSIRGFFSMYLGDKNIKV